MPKLSRVSENDDSPSLQQEKEMAARRQKAEIKERPGGITVKQRAKFGADPRFSKP